MALTYANYAQLFDSRRKSNDYKPMPSGCRLFRNGDDFEVRYVSRLLYTIAPADVVTLHGNGNVMTERRLMGLAVDTYIYSDMAQHGNKSHTIRMRVHGKSKPYAPGIQVRLNHHSRDAHEYSNFPVDMVKKVAATAKKTAKDETETIRKLLKVMARLGAFDEILKDLRSLRQYTGTWLPLSKLNEVNIKDPVGSDAELLFRIGLGCCSAPNHSGYRNGVWTTWNAEELMRIHRDRAVEAGLRALRKRIYLTTEGSYEFTPVQPKAD